AYAITALHGGVRSAAVDRLYGSGFLLQHNREGTVPGPQGPRQLPGTLHGAQGLLCLFVQMMFARAVIARLGVGWTINFHPAFLILGIAWMSLRYGYASVLTTKFSDATMLYTFSDLSYQLLYNPISTDQRAEVRGFIEGYIRPLSLAAVGGLLLLGNKYLKPLSPG